MDAAGRFKRAIVAGLFAVSLSINCWALTPENCLGSIAQCDDLSARLYTDFELDQNPSAVLNQHYWLGVRYTRTVNEWSYLDANIDTALFDWDSDIFTSERLRSMAWFHYVMAPDPHDRDFKKTITYGPGEYVSFHKRVFYRPASGVKLQKDLLGGGQTAELRLKPTFTAESNIKQIRLRSIYTVALDGITLKAGGGWDYSSANTSSLFSKSGAFDEKWVLLSGFEMGAATGSAHLYLDESGAWLGDGSVAYNFACETPVSVSLRYISINGHFIDSSLKNYYSDYGAVDSVDELISDNHSVLSLALLWQYQKTESLLLGWMSRDRLYLDTITTVRLRWEKDIAPDYTIGSEIKLSDPASFGEGYQWEILAFLSFALT